MNLINKKLINIENKTKNYLSFSFLFSVKLEIHWLALNNASSWWHTKTETCFNLVCSLKYIQLTPNIVIMKIFRLNYVDDVIWERWLLIIDFLYYLFISYALSLINSFSSVFDFFFNSFLFSSKQQQSD